MPRNQPYDNPNDPNALPGAPLPPQPAGAPIPASEAMGLPPAGAHPGQGQPSGNEAALMEPIQQMADLIVQLGGPEVLAQILEQGLQVLQQQAPQGAQQGPRELGPEALPSSAPTPGGEGFGPAFG